MSTKIVIIGAGLTGSVLQHLLRQKSPQVQLSIWEKATDAGGRYNTSWPSGATAVAGALESARSRLKAHVDLGAQYVTAFELEAHGHYYESLAKSGVLEEISHDRIHGGRGAHSEQIHYRVPAGMSSIPKFFLGSEANVEFGRQLISLSAEGSTWLLEDDTGKTQQADIVVLTTPIPQVLELLGNVQQTLQPYVDDLKAVSYSARYALGLYYPPEAWAALGEVAWSGKYFSPNDSDVIVWVSVSNLETSRTAGEQGPTIVVHTTVPYGINNAEASCQDVTTTIMEHLNRLVPELAALAPVETELLYWKCSQVYKGFQHSHDTRPAALHVREGPLLILAGDAFTKSGFDGCVESAEAAYDMIRRTVFGESCAEVDVSTAGAAEQAAKAMM